MKTEQQHPVLEYLANGGKYQATKVADSYDTWGFPESINDGNLKVIIEGAVPGQSYSGDELEAVWQYKAHDWLDVPTGILDAPIANGFPIRLHRLRVKKRELPPAIESLSKYIDNAGLKISFGLNAQGHIPTIERLLSEHGNGKYTWEKIGGEIGWDPFTACVHYLSYVLKSTTP